MTYPEFDLYQETESPPLAVVGKTLLRLIRPDLQTTNFHTCELTALTPADDQTWHLTTTAGAFNSKNVVMCLGATPKTLNLPIPTIPLSTAFTSAITHCVNPNEPIVVFGTSHSGVLVLKALKTLGCTQVYAVYKGQDPFCIATTPDAEGLKQEGAVIANEIQTKAWGIQTPTLLSYNDFATLYRIVRTAQAVIYAIGFEPRTIMTPANALTNLFHVGYCKPQISRADIGFAGFIRQVQMILPQICSPPPTP